jgi:hypothetical protein
MLVAEVATWHLARRVRGGGASGRLAAGAVQGLLGHRGPLHSALAAPVARVLAEPLGERLGVVGLGLLTSAGARSAGPRRPFT